MQDGFFFHIAFFHIMIFNYGRKRSTPISDEYKNFEKFQNYLFLIRTVQDQKSDVNGTILIWFCTKDIYGRM